MLLKRLTNTFKLLRANTPVTNETPQFLVGTENGFLPRQEPLIQLPSEYDKLEHLLRDIPINKVDGTHGHLHKGTLFETIQSGALPIYDLSSVTDSQLISALFRDYTFLTSSYILEPCDLQYRKDKTYGLGRDVLPKCIALPLAQLAEKLKVKPFMEYNMSYALYNYYRPNPDKELSLRNMKLIREFEGSKSETGFVAVHVAMVRHTGKMVTAIDLIMTSLKDNQRSGFNKGMKNLLDVMRVIQKEMHTMWQESKPEDYDNFRTYIMGTKNQPMFPKGVLYEGVSDKPFFLRGESGANDSIIPALDNLLQVTENIPVNPLTKVLKDFRTYRPPHHTEFLEWLEIEAQKKGLKEYAFKDAESKLYYYALLDQIREFRNRHWSFTKKYILAFSKHPVATGGSPIITWLPNQLSAVLQMMVDVGNQIDVKELKDTDREFFLELQERANYEIQQLKEEVKDLKVKFPDITYSDVVDEN